MYKNPEIHDWLLGTKVYDYKTLHWSWVVWSHKNLKDVTACPFTMFFVERRSCFLHPFPTFKTLEESNLYC